MTVSAGNVTRTVPELISVRFNSGGRLTLRDVESLHAGIQALIAAGILAARAERMSEWTYSDADVSEPYVRLRDVAHQALEDAADSPIFSIAFSNPYELVASITGGALAATVVAQRCVNIFNNIQRARITKALTDRALLILGSDEVGAFRAKDDAERDENLEVLRALVSRIDALASRDDAEVTRLDGP